MGVGGITKKKMKKDGFLIENFEEPKIENKGYFYSAPFLDHTRGLKGTSALW
jgi:hypothetical protein